MTDHDDISALDPEMPTTGDDEVDLILTDFARVVASPEAREQPDDLGLQVEAAARAHRRLQDRLSAPRA